MAFRGDPNQLDFLKTLPVNSLAMAVGQLAGPAIILAAVQIAIMTICCAATASGGRLLLSTIVLAVPVDLMLLTVSNLVFLIYPVRSSSQAPTDLDLNAVGRGLLWAGAPDEHARPAAGGSRGPGLRRLPGERLGP